MLSIMATMFGQEDAAISIMAQGGFLDYAATGTVTYTALDGTEVTQKVTPDPSIPGENPDGVPGWLDVLASSIYDKTRIAATIASGTQALANSTSNTYGPFAIGTYHVTNPSSGAGYSNAEALTIAPANFVGGGITAATNTTPIVITTASAHGLSGSETMYVAGVLGNTAANGYWAISVLSTTTFSLATSVGNGAYTSGGTANVCTTAAFQSDVAGTAGTSATGTITTPVTALSGVTTSNLGSFVGAAWEGNTALAARCRLGVQALSPNGPHGAYSYFALSASQFLTDAQLSTPVTRAIVQTSAQTGIVNTIVASAAGAVSGVSNLEITGATNATPIVITSASPHTLATGDFASLSGVLGNTAANGTFTITVLSSTTFSLDSSVGNGAYTGGGIIEGGDLGQVDRVIQSKCVPDGITAITSSASGFNVAVVAAVDVPLAQVTAYTAAVQSALAVYFAATPIGGINGELQYNDIIGVLFAAGIVTNQPSYVKRISSLTLNGVAANLAYATPLKVAQLSPAPVIAVTGV